MIGFSVFGLMIKLNLCGGGQLNLHNGRNKIESQEIPYRRLLPGTWRKSWADLSCSNFRRVIRASDRPTRIYLACSYPIGSNLWSPAQSAHVYCFSSGRWVDFGLKTSSYIVREFPMPRTGKLLSLHISNQRNFISAEAVSGVGGKLKRIP